MQIYIPNFKYFLSDAATEDENRYSAAVAIKCWFMLVKYAKEPAMREKLFEIVKLLHDFLDQEEAIEYLDIFFKYLANTKNSITRTDAIKAVESIFQGRGVDMVKGWAQEYVEEGMLFEAREMVLEALDIKFSNNVPPDVHKLIKALNNRMLLKKLHRSAIQSNDIDGFRKSIQELTKES